MTAKQSSRRARLMPRGIPRHVRCYDAGESICDRYTVVFAGRISHLYGGEYPYLGMSARPFHPQGFGMHMTSKRAIDCAGSSWSGPAIGRKCHLGRRIRFQDLPADCQKLVLSDYREIWRV